MPHLITRRDFLNGVALSIAAGLAPLEQVAASPWRYPPALTGLRGHHEGSFEVAHALARDDKAFAIDALPVEEKYDLVVVGAGLSGLAAAYFYRRAAGSRARILILDNHDDFGGHAKRNEFRVGNRLILGYGGSESLQSPRSEFSRVAKDLLKDLRIDIDRFERAFEQTLYPGLGLSRGLFFAREAFGRDALVTGDPTIMVADDIPAHLLNAKPLRAFIGEFPISDASKAQLVELFEGKADPLAGASMAQKIATLKKTSYRAYLVDLCGCSEEVANCFQGRTLDYVALGIDAVSAHEAMELGYPGFRGLGLKKHGNPGAQEPYIYHFPDGNASLARLLVRRLIPGVAPGTTMSDVVLAPFDYGKLDRDDHATRIRLDSTCVRVRNEPRKVDVAYVRHDRLHRIEADRVVLACFNMLIPHIMPELPEKQQEALKQNVKAPLVYTKVAVRDWKPWVKLGIHEISAPMSFHCRVKLDYPVSLGGYRHPRTPSEPMGLHLVHVPGEPNRGLDARDQFRSGRQKLLEMTYDQLEQKIRDELDRMLGAGGFDSARDIAAITINRWSHGYSYFANSLFDGTEASATIVLARKPHGRVAIANSDASWSPYAHGAIDAAHRAVREVLNTQ
jgi:spermidine dehydrogenase